MAIPNWPSNNGLVALAGGGQTGATPLRHQAFNRVVTVATTADSVLLPTAINGRKLECVNSGANSMNMYPQAGEAINALSANAAFAVAAGKVFTAFCPVDGTWFINLTA